MIYNDGKAGFLTVIIGPMFSEKSGELIKQCLLSQNYQNKTVRIYKPVIDDRYGEDEVGLGLEVLPHPYKKWTGGGRDLPLHQYL